MRRCFAVAAMLSLLVLFAGSLVGSCASTAVQPPPAQPKFDGDSAYSFLTAQTDFGPRNPGSQGHTQCLAYLEQQLTKYCDEVDRQDFDFTSKTTFPGQTFSMTNLIGVLHAAQAAQGATPSRILLAAHWDTRPFADRETDPTKRNQPILGASDGASGVAVLLELARVLNQDRPPVEVLFVLFDGEDLGKVEPGLPEFFIGSRHFAQNSDNYKADKGMLLDIVGHKGFRADREAYSIQAAPELFDRIFRKAHALGYGDRFPLEGTQKYVSDDHLQLIQAGIPTVDIIDLDYIYWHTLSDTADECDPAVLKAVGETVLQVVLQGG